MPYKILHIHINHHIDTNIPVSSIKKLEKFRSDLINQCQLDFADDEVSVSFTVATEGMTAEYPLKRKVI